jgi:hypothetical protein
MLIQRLKNFNFGIKNRKNNYSLNNIGYSYDFSKCSYGWSAKNSFLSFECRDFFLGIIYFEKNKFQLTENHECKINVHFNHKTVIVNEEYDVYYSQPDYDYEDED